MDYYDLKHLAVTALCRLTTKYIHSDYDVSFGDKTEISSLGMKTVRFGTYAEDINYFFLEALNGSWRNISYKELEKCTTVGLFIALVVGNEKAKYAKVIK